MDEAKFTLPAFLIADLYKNVLVELPEKNIEIPVAAVIVPDGNAIQYLGNNEKNICIIVYQPDYDYVEEGELQLLSNILKACNLSTQDFAIVNIGKHKYAYQMLKEQLNVQHLLMFGVEPAAIKLPFSIPQFQIQQYAGFSVVLAPALSDINSASPDSRILKTKLWQCLQRLFNL